MALRKPLVLVAGEMQQLQAGDSIDAPQSGGDIIVQTNDEAGAIIIGTPVYNDVSDGVKKAKADATGTKEVIGLVRDVSIAAAAAGVIQINGVLTASTAQWDAVAGTTGGLAPRTPYYLDPATAGKITATAPTTSGQYVARIGVALSTTELKMEVERPILL